jgi:hypothetical protein
LLAVFLKLQAIPARLLFDPPLVLVALQASGEGDEPTVQDAHGDGLNLADSLVDPVGDQVDGRPPSPCQNAPASARRKFLRRCRRARHRFGTLSALSPLPSHPFNRDGPDMNITEFKTELARLIKKGSSAGLSGDDMADELTEAAEDLPSNSENVEHAGKSGWFENDPVGYVIESHRP